MKLSHKELDIVNQPGKKRSRKEYALWFNDRFGSDYSKAVFIDESSFNIHLRRSHGRSKKGTRAILKLLTVRGSSTILIAKMAIDGIQHYKTISHSTVRGNTFVEYIRELCVYLHEEKKMREMCLVLDNARIHRREDIERNT